MFGGGQWQVVRVQMNRTQQSFRFDVRFFILYLISRVIVVVVGTGSLQFANFLFVMELVYSFMDIFFSFSLDFVVISNEEFFGKKIILIIRVVYYE